MTATLSGSAAAEQTAFVRAICEQPADDTPRLVFADWLDERGEAARAEFIRLQIRIAGIRKGCRCRVCAKLRYSDRHHNGKCKIDRKQPDAADLRSEVARLLAPHWQLWCGFGASACGNFPDGQAVGFTGIDFGRLPIVATFRRGFVADVRLRMEDFHGLTGPDLAAAIFRAEPIERVVLHDRSPLSLSGGRIFAWTRSAETGAVPHWLPPRLFDLLPPADPPALIPAPGMYSTKLAAVKALELGAAVAFGRKVARL